MSTPELEDLIARFFEGDLDVAAAARLEELLDLHPDAAERFKGLAEIEGLLRARETDGAAKQEMGDRVMDSVQAEDRRRRLTSRVMKSLKGAARPEPLSRPSRWSAWETIAACLVIGAAASLAFLLIPADRDPGPAPDPTISKGAPRPPIVTPEPLPAPEPKRTAPTPRPKPTRERISAPEIPPSVAPPAPPPAEPPPANVAPAPRPAPPAPRSEPPVRPTTEAAAHVTLEKIQGTVTVLSGPERTPAAAGQGIAVGQGIETGAKKSSAVLVYPDGTRLEVGSGTVLSAFLSTNPGRGRKRIPGKRIVVEIGRVRAVVARQPANEPLRMAAPHGEVRVVGTTFLLAVSPDPKGQTTVHVEEGRVRLTRAWDGDSIDLSAGQFAVAAPDAALAPRAVASDEIVLLPRDGRLVGDEWRLVAERRGTTKLALETRSAKYEAASHVRTRPSYVSFTFFAEAGKDYTVWVRGFSVPRIDPWKRDQLNLQIPGATFSQECAFGHWWEDAYTYTGFSESSTYTWISGHTRNEDRVERPVSVRFDTAGPKTLRVFAAQPWIRVDSIWLSASQTIRPSAKTWPPIRSGK